MIRLVIVFLLSFIIMQANYAFADGSSNSDVNIGNIQSKGFENVSEILKQMSPEQIQELVKQAEAMLPQLKKMKQSEIDSFTNELLNVDSSINTKEIDVKKLDPSKSKDLSGIRNDIKEYRQKNHH